MVKRCTKCGETKPYEDFHRRRDTSDGRQVVCKVCVAAYQREYNARNMARITARSTAWKKANPQRANALSAAGYQRRKGRLKAEQDAARAALARCCELCGGAIGGERTLQARFCSTVCRERAASRRWKQANAEKVRSQRQQYEANNREVINLKAQRRRSRKRGAFVEDVHPLVLLELGDGVCGICGTDVDPNDFHMDHVIPLARGGEHSYANMQVAHPACNSRKRDRLPWEMAA